MAIFNTFYTWFLRSRVNYINHVIENPVDTQMRVFEDLIATAKNTEWGKKYQYNSIQNIEDLKERVPVHNYDGMKPWIERMMNGEQNILWPSDIRWFAKSSGTTSDKSKFIPVSFESLENCHIKAARDLLSIYCNNFPDTKIFSGKGLVMGGSHQINSFNENTSYGDLSAVLMQNLPFWVHFIRTPQLDIALLSDWEEKLEKMANETIVEDVTNISGVPTWTIILFNRVLEITGKKYIDEVWPNLELYVHGGVSFTPYRNQFKQFFRNPINYLETYNASEGFFGLQNDPNSEELLLMLDYGIYYEFMPMSEYGKDFPETKTLDQVVLGEIYALVISTNSGLCRYIVGDTVKFTSLQPFKFLITGRTKHFINAFGEELMIENAEKALFETCLLTNANIKDYTAAPIYFDNHQKPTHEWLIEFNQEPSDIYKFTEILDLQLQKTNSDYEAKRHKDIAMQMPKVNIVKKGVFNEWLKTKGKLGGQHKIPRLSNDRVVIEEILELL